MAWLFGPDPLGLIVPAHLGVVAQADIVDVDEFFVSALLVPDLIAGVPGVVENRSNRAVLPLGTVGQAVSVASWIGCRRAGDPVGVETSSDRVETNALKELFEDADDNRRSQRVGLQAFERGTGRCFPGVRVRANHRELVAVWWPTAEESTLDRRL